MKEGVDAGEQIESSCSLRGVLAHHQDLIEEAINLRLERDESLESPGVV